MDQKYKIMIKELKDEGISRAGITSILFMRGLSGVDYMTTRKYIIKELERLK